MSRKGLLLIMCPGARKEDFTHYNDMHLHPNAIAAFLHTRWEQCECAIVISTALHFQANISGEEMPSKKATEIGSYLHNHNSACNELSNQKYKQILLT